MGQRVWMIGSGVVLPLVIALTALTGRLNLTAGTLTSLRLPIVVSCPRPCQGRGCIRHLLSVLPFDSVDRVFVDRHEVEPLRLWCLFIFTYLCGRCCSLALISYWSKCGWWGSFAFSFSFPSSLVPLRVGNAFHPCHLLRVFQVDTLP